MLPKTRKVSCRVPALFVRRVVVSDTDEFGVFGWYADELHDIVNITGRPIDILLGVSPTETRNVHLDAGAHHHLGLEMSSCIRQRFIPYVQTTETISLDVLWKFHRNDRSPVRRLL